MSKEGVAVDLEDKAVVGMMHFRGFKDSAEFLT
jgi:hypothetical protein